MNLSAAEVRELHDVRRTLSEFEAEWTLLKFVQALKAYNPNQPRVPAGNGDESGEWTEGDGIGEERPNRIQLAELDDPKQYSVNLGEEEARGGHTLRDHVGKSDAELLAELWKDWRRWRTPRYEITNYRPAQGSFFSREDANDLINRTLESNQDKVDGTAKGKSDEALLEKRFGYRTGKEATRTQPDEQPFVRSTYGVRVIIRHDRGSTRGYRVHTAFPINESALGR